MHLITGKKGEPHITAENHGFINAQILGNGNFVFDFGNNFAAVKLNDNSVEIKDGQGMFGGRHFEIEYGTTENVTIENGTLGLNRIDLIVARYAKDSEGIETLELAVKKGTAVSGNPVDPYYDTRTPYTGADGGEFPLWRVNIVGTTIESLEPVYDIVDFDFAQLQLDIQAALGEFEDAMDTINGKSNKDNTPKVWAGSEDPFTIADDTDWPESSEIKVGDIYVKTATNEFYFVKLVTSGGQGAAKLPQWVKLLTAADIANKLDRVDGIKTFFGTSAPGPARASYSGLMSGDIYFEGTSYRLGGSIRKVYVAHISDQNEDLVNWRELTTNLSSIWNNYYTKSDANDLLDDKLNREDGIKLLYGATEPTQSLLNGSKTGDIYIRINGNDRDVSQVIGMWIVSVYPSSGAYYWHNIPLGEYYNKNETNNLLNTKQDTLTAGNNIVIDANNVIKVKERSWRKIHDFTIDNANEGSTVDYVEFESNGGNGIRSLAFSYDEDGNSLEGKGITGILIKLTPTTAININQGFIKFNGNVTRYFINIKNTTVTQWFENSISPTNQQAIITGTTGTYIYPAKMSGLKEISRVVFYGQETGSILGQGSQFEIYAYGYWDEEPTRNLAKGTRLEVVEDFPTLTDEELEKEFEKLTLDGTLPEELEGGLIKNIETDVSDAESNEIDNSEVEKDVSEIETKEEIEPEKVEKVDKK